MWLACSITQTDSRQGCKGRVLRRRARFLEGRLLRRQEKLHGMARGSLSGLFYALFVTLSLSIYIYITIIFFFSSSSRRVASHRKKLLQAKLIGWLGILSIFTGESCGRR
ncbi:alpha/beta-Hydrolases superfamily protein [Zea mays]|uniref:Alpha/beta-Hydrolases superfamily protein n=1 Tax=Zea mays TaxID=4577 RepID=A0A1D6Q0B5_MAIZE|nr:alpha/beta-Hydrolases superfamily protein [Zea mays]